LRLVQPAREGKIKRIELAAQQQQVNAGEAIAYLDDSQLQTQKQQLQGNLQQASSQLSQLNAQIEAIDRQIAAESEQQKRILAAARAELSLTQRSYEDKRITTTAEVQQAEANLQLAIEDWERAKAELKSAQAQLESTEAAWQSAITKRDRYQTVADSGALPQNQLEEAKLAAQQQEQALLSQRATVQAHHHSVQRQAREIEAARGRLSQVKAALNPSSADVEIAKEKIAQEKARGEAILANLKRERQQLVQQRVGIENQLSSDRAELQQVEVELKNTVIRAPVSGIIQELALRNPEQVVHPGDVIARIAPSDAPLEIKALVASQDITKVEVGQTVQFRVSACPYPDYGTLKGKVIAIAPDANVPQEGSKNGSPAPSMATPTYGVTVQPEKVVLKAFGNECSIQAGMDGRADIISREETALQFVLRKTKLLVEG
jgi:HlyD family secretion protein